MLDSQVRPVNGKRQMHSCIVSCELYRQWPPFKHLMLEHSSSEKKHFFYFVTPWFLTMLTESSLHVNVDTDCELLRAEDVRMLMQLASAFRSILVKLEPRTCFSLNDQPKFDN